MNPASLELDDAVGELRSSYDEIPYYLHAHASSHPDRLYALARLRGIPAARPNRCRVLELACGRGGGLVALAQDSPDSQFLGIDLSPRHIEEARKLAEQTGTDNVEFRQGDLLELPDRLGEFDYILAQGVFTWVPVPVREKILAICTASLSPHGLACIAYASRPGYYVDLAVRDMVLFHVAHIEDRDERLEQAKQFIELMANVLADSTHPHRHYLAYLHGSMKEYSANFYHEILNVETLPLYFYEFSKLAGAHGLKYVCDTAPDAHQHRTLLERARKELGSVSDPLRREQYKDFLMNRRGRESVLCLKTQKLRLPHDPASLYDMHIASAVKPKSKTPKLEDDTREGFELADGAITFSTNPATKLALAELGRRWPCTISFDALVEHVLSQLPQAGDADNRRWVLARDLLACQASGLLDLRARALNCVTEVSAKPLASVLARYYAEHGDRGGVVNQRRDTLALDTFSREVLQLLDGTRTRDELVTAMTKKVVDRKLHFQEGGEDVDPNVLPHYIAVALDKTLRKLARTAYLIG
ncbi:MAG: class I SAM-dependent methyltransferase [Arenicellales bacterium]